MNFCIPSSYHGRMYQSRSLNVELRNSNARSAFLCLDMSEQIGASKFSELARQITAGEHWRIGRFGFAGRPAIINNSYMCNSSVSLTSKCSWRTLSPCFLERRLHEQFLPACQPNVGTYQTYCETIRKIVYSKFYVARQRQASGSAFATSM